MQVETQKVQAELDQTDFEGYDEEETVCVTVTGNQKPKFVEITDAAMAAGPDELSRRCVG